MLGPVLFLSYTADFLKILSSTIHSLRMIEHLHDLSVGGIVVSACCSICYRSLDSLFFVAAIRIVVGQCRICAYGDTNKINKTHLLTIDMNYTASCQFSQYLRYTTV